VLLSPCTPPPELFDVLVSGWRSARVAERGRSGGRSGSPRQKGLSGTAPARRSRARDSFKKKPAGAAAANGPRQVRFWWLGAFALAIALPISESMDDDELSLSDQRSKLNSPSRVAVCSPFALLQTRSAERREPAPNRSGSVNFRFVVDFVFALNARTGR
jgi:hypothetical protein